MVVEFHLQRKREPSGFYPTSLYSPFTIFYRPCSTIRDIASSKGITPTLRNFVHVFKVNCQVKKKLRPGDLRLHPANIALCPGGLGLCPAENFFPASSKCVKQVYFYQWNVYQRQYTNYLQPEDNFVLAAGR